MARILDLEHELVCYYLFLVKQGTKQDTLYSKKVPLLVRLEDSSVPVDHQDPKWNALRVSPYLE